MLIEEMQEQDIERVIEIIREAMNDEQADYSNKIMRQYFREQDNEIKDARQYFVAKKDGKIVGISGLVKDEWNVAWVGWFAVAEKEQRKGIGTLMLENVIAKAREKGYRKLLVETYSDDDFEKARNFYEKQGFSIDGSLRDYTKDDVDAVYYGMRLEHKKGEKMIDEKVNIIYFRSFTPKMAYAATGMTNIYVIGEDGVITVWDGWKQEAPSRHFDGKECWFDDEYLAEAKAIAAGDKPNPKTGSKKYMDVTRTDYDAKKMKLLLAHLKKRNKLKSQIKGLDDKIETEFKQMLKDLGKPFVKEKNRF